jgi:hypothetical protein
MTSYRGIRYRTLDGRATYGFTFEWLPDAGTWRIYIDDQPDYGVRPRDAHSTHRLGLAHRPYICWTRPLPTYQDARRIAALWADATQTYIEAGHFPAPVDRGPPRDVSVLAGLTEDELRTGRRHPTTPPPPERNP